MTNQASESSKKVIQIEGMSCGHCTSSVDKALRALPGVSDVQVDLTGKKATVEMTAALSDEILRKAITDLDFSVVSISAA